MYVTLTFGLTTSRSNRFPNAIIARDFFNSSKCCFMRAKCVKCLSTSCTIITSNTCKPKCSNCKVEHSVSYRGCPAHKTLLVKVNAQSQQKIQMSKQTSILSWHIHIHIQIQYKTHSSHKQTQANHQLLWLIMLRTDLDQYFSSSLLMHILFYNAKELHRQTLMFSHFLRTHRIDIALINETYLNHTYTIYRTIAIRNIIKYQLVPTPKLHVLETSHCCTHTGVNGNFCCHLQNLEIMSFWKFKAKPVDWGRTVNNQAGINLKWYIHVHHDT